MSGIAVLSEQRPMALRSVQSSSAPLTTSPGTPFGRLHNFGRRGIASKAFSSRTVVSKSLAPSRWSSRRPARDPLGRHSVIAMRCGSSCKFAYPSSSQFNLMCSFLGDCRGVVVLQLAHCLSLRVSPYSDPTVHLKMNKRVLCRASSSLLGCGCWKGETFDSNGLDHETTRIGLIECGQEDHVVCTMSIMVTTISTTGSSFLSSCARTLMIARASPILSRGVCVFSMYSINHGCHGQPQNEYRGFSFRHCTFSFSWSP